MAPIVESVEISKPPQEVFAYLDDLARHGEWQGQIVEVVSVSDGPTRVGSRATDKRRVPGGMREVTYEIVEHDPPRRTRFHGIDGPIRPSGPSPSSRSTRGRARASPSSSTSRAMASASFCCRSFAATCASRSRRIRPG